MVILGIDHGSRTGISAIEDGVCVHTSTVTVDLKADNALAEYFYSIQFILNEYNPNLVALEVPRHSRNGDIYRKLVGLYTVIKLSCEIRKIKVIEVDPRTMKKFITGKGNAEKNEVMECLITRWAVRKDLVYKPVYYKAKRLEGQIKEYLFDESDATGLALYAYHRRRSVNG